MFGELFNLFGTITVNSQGAMRTLNTFETKVKGMSNRLGASAKNIGGVVSNNIMGFGTASLGVAGVLGYAAKKAMDFEAQLSSISSLMSSDEKTPENLKKIKDYALEMGAKTKYSALEAAQGMEEMIKAGVSLDKVLSGGLEDALNLATAGELSLAEAAEIMSTAMNSFNAEGLTSAKAANLLAGAANASATDVHDLKYALSSSAAVASLAGMNFEDTAGALAIMAQAGLKGSDAGTSLKSMMMNLIPKTAEQYELFKQFGLFTYDAGLSMQFLTKNGIKPASSSMDDITAALKAYAAQTVGAKVGSQKAEKAYREMAFSQGLMHSAFYDEKGEMKDLAQMADILQKAFGGLTKEQQSYYLGQIFGSDGIRGAANIMKAGADGVKKMQTEMGKVTAEQVAEERLNNTKGAIEKLKGALETLAITIGDKLTPYIRKAAEWINKLVDQFNALPKSQQDMIIKIGLIMAGIVLLLPVIGFLASSFMNIINVFSLFGRGGMGLLRMLGLIRGPQGAAGGVSMFTKFGNALKGLWGFLGRLGSGLLRVGGFIMRIGPIIGRVIGFVFRLIGMFGRIGNVVRIAFTIARVAMLAFSGPIGWIVAAIIGLIMVIWRFRDEIGAALGAVGRWVWSLCQDIGSAFSSAWDGVVVGWKAALGWIKDLMMPIGEWVDKWVVGPIKKAWNWAKNAYSDVKGFLFGGDKGGDVKAYANGGVVTEPHMGIVGEAGPEVIIPVSGKRRGRGIELLQKAAELLGVRMYANGGVVGNTKRAAVTAFDAINNSNDQIGVGAGASEGVYASFKKVLELRKKRYEKSMAQATTVQEAIAKRGEGHKLRNAVKNNSKFLKGAKLASKIARPVAYTMDALDILTADNKKDRIRATVKVAGGIGGGILGGAATGALLGTMFMPGVGTAVGGAIGGVLGALGGEKLATTIHDNWGGITKTMSKGASAVGNVTSKAFKGITNAGKSVVGGAKKLFGGWFEKGGVFNAPQVIGVGEAGAEAVIPLKSSVLSQIGAGVAKTMGTLGGKGGGVTFMNATFQIHLEKLHTDADIEKMRSAIQTVVADDLFSRAIRNF